MADPILSQGPTLPGVTLRYARHEDAAVLGPLLRPADRAEIMASSGHLPVPALEIGVRYSQPGLVAVEDGVPFCMFGVVPKTDRVGYVWLVGTPRLETIPVSFVRSSRRILDSFQERYPVLTNFTDARNTTHHKLLEWLGCQIIATHEEYGVERRPFHEFVRK